MSIQKMKGKSDLWAKLNSNIVILILGSLITGILVPIFQNNQRTLEWRRQIKYEEVSFQIEMVRKCLAEFMTAAAFTSEAMERVMPFIEKQSISKAEYDKFINDFVQMQNLRFRQNVKVASFAIYFDEQNEIQNLINTYTANSTNYIRECENFIRFKYCITNHQDCSEGYDIDTYEFAMNESLTNLKKLKDVQNSFNQVLERLQKEVENIQRNNQDFNF